MRASLAPLFRSSIIAYRNSSIIGLYFISTMDLVFSSMVPPIKRGIVPPHLISERRREHFAYCSWPMKHAGLAEVSPRMDARHLMQCPKILVG